MSNMHELYARALWDIVGGGTKPEKAVAGLREALVRNGRLALLSKIRCAFQKIAAREIGRREVRLFVAKENDKRTAEREVVEQLNLKNPDLRLSVDRSLIGGWRGEAAEELIDRSFKKHLLSLYTHVTES